MTRCTEELIILRAEMQMCYLGYTSKARLWAGKRNAVAGSSPHTYMAEDYIHQWWDLAAYAKSRFNLCYSDVITDSLVAIDPEFDSE